MGSLVVYVCKKPCIQYYNKLSYKQTAAWEKKIKNQQRNNCAVDKVRVKLCMLLIYYAATAIGICKQLCAE